MGILGIANRTENWKTARCFAPFIQGDGSLSNLARRLGEPEEIPPENIRIELFWTGMRDYLHQLDNEKEDDREQFPRDLAERYRRLFGDLRESIRRFGGFWSLREHNYEVSPIREQSLYDNLRNTEIDIVLETPQHLFIGEAKGEMTFGANGGLVLVHQLIRQYVMAVVLVDLLVSKGCPQKRVVPFVVGDAAKLERNQQVRFMRCQGWLDGKNMLDWKDIPKLHGQDGAGATA